ncbi:MAG: glycosyltransferase family 4 protein [Bacteroidales bacterium]|nr:glycosyltransferase family 4 protein [Bacteroidales bacterium]
MRILQICNKPPYPPIEGGPIAMNAITQGLIESGHEVQVLAVRSSKFAGKELPEEYRSKTSYQEVDIDLSIKPLQALINLFSLKSLHVERYKTKSFYAKITEILKNQEFDIIHFESIFLAFSIPIIRKYSKAKIVIRTHNVEHLIWKRLAKNEANWFKKLYLQHITNTLKRFELNIVNKADGILSITEQDARFFRGHNVQTPIIELPFGINLKSIKIAQREIKSEKPSLFFIGSLNWQPNVEGMEWFLKKVWNHPGFDFSEYELHIAGRHTPPHFYEFANETTFIHGEVDDALQFMANHDVMIVPLWSGSGVRIKIIEAFLMEKAVISTTVGAEGLNYTNGTDIFIADNADAFSESIQTLLKNAENCEKIGKNARKLISDFHNNELIINKLIDFYKEL